VSVLLETTVKFYKNKRMKWELETISQVCVTPGKILLPGLLGLAGRTKGLIIEVTELNKSNDAWTLKALSQARYFWSDEGPIQVTPYVKGFKREIHFPGLLHRTVDYLPTFQVGQLTGRISDFTPM
jgi:hypothetical protein